MAVIKPSLHLLTVWRLRLFLCSFLPSFLAACFFSNTLLWWAAALAIAAGFVFLYIFYCPVKWKKLAYSGNENCLVIHCGVIYTSAKAVPFGSIQSISITSTPLERLFGICSLAVFMAGARIYMPGLTPVQAEELRLGLEGKSQEASK